MFRQTYAALKLQMLMEVHLQVCDIIHDGPAFDRMTLRVDEVKIDLKTKTQQSSRIKLELSGWSKS